LFVIHRLSFLQLPFTLLTPEEFRMAAFTDLNAPRAAEAGHWGEDIRSDLHVKLEPRTAGGIEIELESRVALYYGKTIRAQALSVLETLGVAQARVTIHDAGALPYVDHYTSSTVGRYKIEMHRKKMSLKH
jgi:citrate lyase acyl carrier protein